MGLLVELIERSKQVNDCFCIATALLGSVVVYSINPLYSFPGFLIFGLIGYLLRPYNKLGEHRY